MSAFVPMSTPQPLLGIGQVRHTRLRPARHAFAYGTFFMLLPMRTLQQCGDAALAINRAGLLSFYDQDHGDGRDAQQGGALAWMDETLRAHGIDDADGEIWLHTYPRVLGYVFKPVSFWYCHRRDGQLRAIVAEVNNTFGERHCYLLDQPQWGAELTAEKVFHVSPFCKVEGRYRFRFLRTEQHVVARIEHDDANGPLILTSLSGALQLATRRAQWQALLHHPMMSLMVIVRIHWHALQLWLKRVPFFRKPQPPQTFVTH